MIDRRQFLRGLAAGCVTMAVPATMLQPGQRVLITTAPPGHTIKVDWVRDELRPPSGHSLDAMRYMISARRCGKTVYANLLMERARLGLT